MGLSHNLPPENLAFVTGWSGVRTICAHADGLIIGKSTAKPAFHEKPLVASQIARFVYGMVRHWEQFSLPGYLSPDAHVKGSRRKSDGV